ncbi:MAG: hypothetical protein Crog4KO_27600 [Crocinitomicaceae bacterium]
MKKTLLFSARVSAVALLFLTIYSCETQKNPSEDKNEPAKALCEPITEKDGIHTLKTACQFEEVMTEISQSKNSLFVFDIDNTLLITNDNKFGSDWWYSQTKKDSTLKLNVDGACLFDVLTPVFYAMFDTKPVFDGQPKSMESLETGSNKIIACTSRGYSKSVGTSTDLELAENSFDFMRGDTMDISNNVVMRNDIIYTKGNNKGDALLVYLEKHPYDHVFYFDDSDFKVLNVQEAFKKANKKVALYHLEIAPKIPYTEKEKTYMKEKLCNVIETLKGIEADNCNCQN